MSDDSAIVAAPMECDECGVVVYVKPERLDSDDALTCDEHSDMTADSDTTREDA